MIEYADRYGFDEETTDDFWQVMRVIDQEHCRRVLDRMPKPKKPTPDQPPVKFKRRPRG